KAMRMGRVKGSANSGKDGHWCSDHEQVLVKVVTAMSFENNQSLERVPALKDLLHKWARERPRNRIVVNAKDGSVLVHVPAGEFDMGSAEGRGSGDERPKHKVELSGYWIGVYAVTDRQYLKFMAATKHRAPDSTRHKEAGLTGHPVTDV